MEIVIKEFLKLLLKAAQGGIAKLAKNPIEKLKLENKLRESIAETLYAIQPYLDSEGISTGKQEFLLMQCLLELKPLLKKPEEFLRGSLDGQTLYQRCYGQAGPPQAIHEEKLDIPFRLVFPRIADRFNAYLPLTEQGKALGLIETLRRFDEINNKFAEVAAQLREYTQRDLEYGDENFHILHGIILENVLGRLGVTGLLGKYRYEITLDDIFVLPALTQKIQKGGRRSEREIRLNTPDDSVEALFKVGTRAFVEGQPGAGKTTWTCWLQSLALKRNPRLLAIRLRFRDFPSGDLPNYYELVRSVADPNLKARIKDAQVDQWIKDARLIFLLDGFDEVAPGHRKTVRQWIDGLNKTATKAPIILTSRPLSTKHLEELPKLWGRWQMMPFDQPRVKDYIDRWYKHHPHLAPEQRAIDAPGLASQWQGDPSLKDLTANPLMLGTLLTVHQHEGKTLPRGRSKLYERYIEGMLGPWEQNIPVRRDLALSEDQKLELLKGIALHMLLKEVDAIDEDDTPEREGLHSIVSGLIEPLNIKPPHGFAGDLAPLVLSELRERTGMLDGPGTYSFVHKSIAEFLFSKILNDGHLKTSEGDTLNSLWLLQRRHEDRWRGVLYFWAGLTAIKDLQTFIQLIGEHLADSDMLLELALLYDQLDRLPKAWLRERVLRLNQVPSSNPADIRIHFRAAEGVSGLEYKAEVWHPQVPDLTRKDLYSALHEIMESADLTWEDFTAASAPWQSAVWLACFDRAYKERSFSSMLSNKLVLLSEHGNRDHLILHFAFEIIRYQVAPIDSSLSGVESILAARPELNAKAAILWCDAINDAFWGDDGRSHRVQNACEDIGKYVPLLKSLNVDADLLVATYQDANKNEGDILQSARSKLQKIIDSSTSVNPAQLLITQEYVSQLIAQREALLLVKGGVKSKLERRE
jgi:hypothetical protein